VVADLDLDAALRERRHDRLADVPQRVGRGNGEVAFLVSRLVPEVRELLAAAVPDALDAIDVVVAAVRLGLIEANVVEEEELGLRAHERRIADARLLEIRLGLLGNVARVAGVGLFRDRVEDRTGEADRRRRIERIHHRRRRVRDHHHVRRVDWLPASDRGAVERQAVLEEP
jgi:hypothetical protein